jgi:hypothetical protein
MCLMLDTMYQLIKRAGELMLKVEAGIAASKPQSLPDLNRTLPLVNYRLSPEKRIGYFSSYTNYLSHLFWLRAAIRISSSTVSGLSAA